MVQPTVGRVVLYTPNKTGDNLVAKGQTKLAAIITHVHSPAYVNLAVFDSYGGHHSRTSVPLIQDGGDAPDGGFYCEWMPYQKGQAAKTEELEKKLAEANQA